MRCLVIAAIFSTGIAAQSFTLGSSSDPCAGGNVWVSPPLRFGDFTCTIFAPPGSYTVTLGFQEPVVTAAGGRLFDLTLNGLKVLASFDLVASGATSSSVVISKSFPVTSDGSIRIQLTTVKRSAVLSSINVTQVQQQPAGQLQVDTFAISCPAVNCAPDGTPAVTYTTTKPAASLLLVFRAISQSEGSDYTKTLNPDGTMTVLFTQPADTGNVVLVYAPR